MPLCLWLFIKERSWAALFLLVSTMAFGLQIRQEAVAFAPVLLGFFLLWRGWKTLEQARHYFVGLIVLSAVKFVAPHFGVVIAWPWFALIGAVATFSVGYLASFLTRQNDKTE